MSNQTVVTSDPEIIRAYVQGHFAALQRLAGERSCRLPNEQAFYSGAVTALQCVFGRHDDNVPNQIHPQCLQKAMGIH